MLFDESDVNIDLNPMEFVRPVTGADRKSNRKQNKDESQKKEREKDSFETSNKDEWDKNNMRRIHVNKHSNVEELESKGGKIDIVIQ